MKREMSISGDISVTELKQKAKNLGGALNEYCLAAISVACHEVT